jgi:hypothetical protein
MPAALLVALVGGASAQAAFPGPNGQIAYQVDAPASQIWTVFLDGTGSRTIGTGSGPAWSSDGQQIAFSRTQDGSTKVYVAAPDGSQARVVADGHSPAWAPDGTHLAYVRNDNNIYVTDIYSGGETKLTDSTQIFLSPAWSPDGTKIAFKVLPTSGSVDIYTMNPDGTDVRNLTPTSTLHEGDPDWSPDSSKIVYSATTGSNLADQIRVMNADGTGVTELTPGGRGDQQPVWSPDGTKIAFSSFRNVAGGQRRIWIMNADGSAEAALTPTNQTARSPDWQPARVTGYPRPKSASPLHVSLVPSHNGCAAFIANESHGPPLAFPSCSPPTLQSTTLTVGTPDANGVPAQSVASARLAAVAGDPGTPADEADVQIGVAMTDVRCAGASAACPGGAVSAFSGTMLLTANMRLTDRLNGSPGPGTMRTIGLHVPFTCAPTADPTIGSSCALSTTMDAVTPGAVPEGQRSIWEFGDVQVWDPGPNGTGYANCPPTCGNGDEAAFMRQGVFIP